MKFKIRMINVNKRLKSNQLQENFNVEDKKW